MAFIGVDLHTNSFTICRLQDDGSEGFETFTLSASALEAFCLNRGRNTKRGNKLMRTTLVQCTLVAIRYSGYLNAFYQRIKERRGAGKAIIATARKLLSIIYDTLKNGWVFEDFPNFKIKQNQYPTGQPS